MSEIKHTPVTDDTFIMGYKVGAGLHGTRAEAEKAIRRGEGSSWIPLYRKNHVRELSDDELDDILREFWSYQGVPSEKHILSAMRAAIAKATGGQS